MSRAAAQAAERRDGQGGKGWGGTGGNGGEKGFTIESFQLCGEVGKKRNLLGPRQTSLNAIRFRKADYCYTNLLSEMSGRVIFPK